MALLYTSGPHVAARSCIVGPSLAGGLRLLPGHLACGSCLDTWPAAPACGGWPDGSYPVQAGVTAAWAAALLDIRPAAVPPVAVGRNIVARSLDRAVDWQPAADTPDRRVDRSVDRVAGMARSYSAGTAADRAVDMAGKGPVDSP